MEGQYILLRLAVIIHKFRESTLNNRPVLGACEHRVERTPRLSKLPSIIFPIGLFRRQVSAQPWFLLRPWSRHTGKRPPRSA